ncbi:NinG recombination protein [Aggregatibacter actinomycetemcomitans]|uniref:NinG recombination protein n=1 Tax=Aggregatibacter actinomycetemcomitans TaxID=714 RepID=A0A5D0EIC6_AGGAC|nr:recombination protein NinG [Aggregatibacter actinomycetemcomitans]NP_852744.1 NinG/ Rap DNA junction specific endonuclease [Haemophilus phage Aaphi23]AMQ94617.1 NinG recombination protein [Aggregatibacter actinomycetemcomitans]MCE3057956.1 recombination protein NinG [Aggregatibacter actinomycetemcomitans]TYA21711.1 recombination protein NinG [Aggregatibacter actinomycetemcomitans]TYA34441.1 recombination protein NinG [Aggregatibacter actinomycetemcomitans]TYA39493.1 recombination protein N
MRVKSLKPKKCKSCGVEFIPTNSLQKVCSPKCAIELARKNAQEAHSNAEKKKLKERKAKLKDSDRGHWLRLLQREVNKFIRLRDKGKPCIACGAPWKPSFQASHFIPQGRSSFLRFHEDNIHSGCIRCNLFVGGGNIHGYRPRLVDKIGSEKVEWLEENQHQTKKWEIAELKEMIKLYRAKIKALEGAN